MTGKANRQNLLKYASAGVEFAITFCLPLLGGLYLDSRLGTTPGFGILGAACGFAVATYRLVRKGTEILKFRRPRRNNQGENRR